MTHFIGIYKSPERRDVRALAGSAAGNEARLKSFGRPTPYIHFFFLK